MRVIEGKMIGTGLRFAIIASRFNELITSKLIEGAKDALVRHDVKHQDIDLFWTPGAWEQPLIAKEIALTGKYDAIIALGAVIKGDTSHNEYIANETAKGLALIALEQKIPVTFGVITCDTLEQALMRSGSKAGNKGAESALAALEAANVLKETRSLIEGCNK
ncbi:MAG: 6,7-dimethyl-8-ribityllumazine synthase [Synergistaceae bacterium]|jgi:6,7-dimethyl-8-ribityllumazine synthase|nr:6,7-dimethyl-8-ribityllumazine synthase [Synergistaceae bacterium]